MVKTKKAISPVVATALLLVVAVVAVVGFQQWFATYQSGINAKVEQEAQAGSAIGIERLQENGTVYIKNSATDPVNVTVSISGESGCLNDNITVQGSSISSDSLGCTLTKGQDYSVVAETDSGVFSETEIAR